MLCAHPLLGGCSQGAPAPPVPDLQIVDATVDAQAFDATSDSLVLDASVDQAPPDASLDLSPDLPISDLSVDIAPCGNGKVDLGETCDRAIPVGLPGACPQTCDDGNSCTTDSKAGDATTCDVVCTNTPIQLCCGNGTIEGAEQCDDANKRDQDGCSNSCQLPGGHLLITEVAVSPTEAEFVEIYNPTTTAIPLENIYLTDRADYHMLPSGSLAAASFDFLLHFPAGSQLKPGTFATIALNGQKFQTAYGKAPDYEIFDSSPSIQTLIARDTRHLGALAGLADDGELLMLFHWNGQTDTVADIDYVRWTGSSAVAAHKTTTTCLDGPDSNNATSCYVNDTAEASQSTLIPPQPGGSIHRCNYLERGEVKAGGNGETGHDETSEPFSGANATWGRNPSTPSNRTPGAAAPRSICP
ncbi:MAG: lamin tail domain-containing protein [Deltaproteobacteria bacterium]|nr:lamin tail domain-containing protein [Deltaproteobacteria bacterium]